MSGQVLTTPWSRAECKRLDIDTVALAARLPTGAKLHLSGRSGRGPWFVRLYVAGREVSPRDEYNAVPVYGDLGHAIDYVLLEGEK